MGTMDGSDAVVALLEELVAWTRFAGRSAFAEALRPVLENQKQLRAYELSDGVRTQAQVAKDAGLSQPRVSALWSRWRRMGIVMDNGGRVRHLASPSDMGLSQAPIGDDSEVD